MGKIVRKVIKEKFIEEFEIRYDEIYLNSDRIEKMINFLSKHLDKDKHLYITSNFYNGEREDFSLHIYERIEESNQEFEKCLRLLKAREEINKKQKELKEYNDYLILKDKFENKQI